MVRHRATRDPETLAKIIDRASEIHEVQGGHFAIAHLERSYIELVNEGAIEPFRGNMEDSGALTLEQYRSLPAAVVAQKYMRDAKFKAEVNSLIARGLI
jgi:hypothetical protein